MTLEQRGVNTDHPLRLVCPDKATHMIQVNFKQMQHGKLPLIAVCKAVTQFLERLETAMEPPKSLKVESTWI